MMRMNQGLMVVLLAVVALMVSGCCGPLCSSLTRSVPEISTRRITGSGALVTRELDLEGFTKLEISSAFEVELTQSSIYSVLITTDDNVVDDVRVTLSGNTLSIDLRPLTLNLGNVTLRAEISMPRLEGAELSGASRLEGYMDTEDVRFETSGASRLFLEGDGGDLRLDASGASRVDLSEFRVDDADLEISGASDVTVYVTGRLDVEASGASKVRYLGNPRMGTVDSSGASSVSPAD
jgi:hypothetical protein